MTPAGRTPRRILRGLAALAAAALLCPAAPAHALPTPVSPSDPSVADQWVNPYARPEERTDVGVNVTAAPSVLREGESLRVMLSVHNNSGETVSGLSVVARRAAATPTVGEARQALALGRDAYPYFAPTVNLSRPLAAGERTELTYTVDAATFGLGAGTYPVMFSLSGRVGDGPMEQLGTDRFLLHVEKPTPETSEAPEAPADRVPGLSLLIPLTAPVDIVPGETGRSPEQPPLILQSEDLARELAPGGRLDDLLNTYGHATTTGPNAAELADSTCLAVDPALVDTVARMAEGYTVAETRPPLTEKSRRLRDSWGSNERSVPGEPGRGAEDAGRFLERLSATAGAGCTVALPWANADLNAVAATEDEWLFREAVQRGPATLQQVLGAAPAGNVVLPSTGYVTEQTATFLGWADQTRSTVLEHGMHATWEAAVAARSPRLPDEDADSSLDSPVPADADGSTGSPVAPVPDTPVQVLVADNTVWGVPVMDGFARLAPGITAVTYPGALGALLAATGPLPETVGYGNPVGRFQHTRDSVLARSVTAGAALRLAVAEQTLPGTWAQTPQQIIAVPGARLDARTAENLLATSAALLASDAAHPLPLDAAVIPPRELEEQPVSPPTLGVTRFGSPYADPAVFSDTEILRASQQARYTDDLTRMMMNDQVIHLTRYGFTLPLRRDVLSSLSATSRSSLAAHEEAVAATHDRLDGNRHALQELRGSVALIPPGNVYTRVSESSPLLIVAGNGLPLPVDAEMAWSGPEGVVLSTPGRVRIPAHGSITVQMTADLPAGKDRTQLLLWLATRDGSTISAPVEITVQTRAGIVGTYGIALLTVVGLSLALLFRVGRHRRRRQNR